MATSDLERFRALCLDERELWSRLGPIADRGAFVALAVELAAGRGLAVTAADLEAALDEQRRAWLEREVCG